MLFRVGRFRTGDLTRGARFNKRAGPKGLSASSNLAISSKKTAPQSRGAVFLQLRLEFELATSNAKHFTIKRTASPRDAVRQFESSYQLQKSRDPIGVSAFFVLVGIELATSRAERVTITGQAQRACPPVRIWLSRRRKLHIACDDFFLLRIKSRLALIPLLLLSKSKPHGRCAPRRQLRRCAVPGFDFVGTRDSGDHSAQLGKGRCENGNKRLCIERRRDKIILSNHTISK